MTGSFPQQIIAGHNKHCLVAAIISTSTLLTQRPQSPRRAGFLRPSALSNLKFSFHVFTLLPLVALKVNNSADCYVRTLSKLLETASFYRRPKQIINLMTCLKILTRGDQQPNTKKELPPPPSHMTSQDIPRRPAEYLCISQSDDSVGKP